ncbi:MAG: D-2-hydroxyacid dehydrogenase [Halobacteriaceae archaeon]
MTADIVVLRQKTHGMSAADYAETLRERFPDRDIVRARTAAEEERLLKEVPIATGYEIDAETVAESSLDLFACVFAGTGHLPLDAFEDHGVAVTSAAGVHAPNVSEHAVGAVLSFARRFDVGWRRTERREWRSYQTRELANSTVTVVGLGNIGTAVAERLDPFDAHTVGVRHSPSKGGPTDEVIGYDTETVHEALSRSDYVVVTAPLSDLTEGLIDAEALRTLPPEAVIVNVGRGPIVDTDALVDALRSNAIGGAALDVTDPEPLPEDHPLWNFDNVLITPHNAGHTPAYWDRLADILAENLAHVDETGTYEGLKNQVV